MKTRQPITGFTIELDGEPEYVERVLRAAQNEMQKCIDAKRREHEDWLGPLRLDYPFVRSLYPFQGTITHRSPTYKNKTAEERISDIERRLDAAVKRMIDAGLSLSGEDY
jgi:hypothetical protein